MEPKTLFSSDGWVFRDDESAIDDGIGADSSFCEDRWKAQWRVKEGKVSWNLLSSADKIRGPSYVAPQSVQDAYAAYLAQLVVGD